MSMPIELSSEAVDKTIGNARATTCVIVAGEMSVSTELSSEAVDETIGSAGAMISTNISQHGVLYM
jgi:hypothetical protein